MACRLHSERPLDCSVAVRMSATSGVITGRARIPRSPEPGEDGQCSDDSGIQVGVGGGDRDARVGARGSDQVRPGDRRFEYCARTVPSHCAASSKPNTYADSRFGRASDARCRRAWGGNAITVANGDESPLLLVDRQPASRTACSCMRLDVRAHAGAGATGSATLGNATKQGRL